MARKLFGLTLEETEKFTNIPANTLHEIENNRSKHKCKRTVSRPTLEKLALVFPEELVLTPYYRFVLHQGEYLKDIDTEYLSNLFNLLPSTIKRWKKEIYTVNEQYFLKLKNLSYLD